MVQSQKVNRDQIKISKRPFTGAHIRKGGNLNSKHQLWRNKEVETANEQLLNKMVKIVNVSFWVISQFIVYFLEEKWIPFWTQTEVKPNKPSWHQPKRNHLSFKEPTTEIGSRTSKSWPRPERHGSNPTLARTAAPLGENEFNGRRITVQHDVKVECKSKNEHIPKLQKNPSNIQQS